MREKEKIMINFTVFYSILTLFSKNFELDENGESSPKRVENTVKRNSSRAISPFPTVFSKDFYTRAGYFWERVKVVNPFPNDKSKTFPN